MEINKDKIIGEVVENIPEFFADYTKRYLEKYYDKLMDTSIGKELKNTSDIKKKLMNHYFIFCLLYLVK